MLKPLTVICAGLALCTLTTSSIAGSAWVLWTQEASTQPELVTSDEKEWRRLAAFENKPACLADASAKAEALAKILSSIPSLARAGIERFREDYLAVKSTFSDGVIMWTFYQCWPDSVDPRGPKGR